MGWSVGSQPDCCSALLYSPNTAIFFTLFFAFIRWVGRVPESCWPPLKCDCHACMFIFFGINSICVLAGENQLRIFILLLLLLYMLYSHELDFICVFFNEYYHFHDHFQNVNSVDNIVNNVNGLSLIRFVEYPLKACKILPV